MRYETTPTRFAQEYLVDRNGAAAAVRAGYWLLMAPPTTCRVLYMGVPETRLLQVANCSIADSVANVVFVHGLNGDPVTTWTSSTDNSEGRRGAPPVEEGIADSSWLSRLGASLPAVRIWSLGYPAHSSAWSGAGMSLPRRAKNVLETLRLQGFSNTPLIFVAHSLGGLLVKAMLRIGSSGGNSDWESLVKATRGVLFLGTPHGGSAIASIHHIFRLIARSNETIEDLRHNSPYLEELNEWFRNNFSKLRLRCHVLREGQKTFGVMVVDPLSADPGIDGVHPVDTDADHIALCKPTTADSLIYTTTVDFIRRCCEPPSAIWDDAREDPINPTSLQQRAPVSIIHPIVRGVPGFTGRQAELERITRALWDRDPATQSAESTVTAALHGLTGTGKSVLAQEYAWRNRARYRGVWWLRAERRETLMEDLMVLAKRVVPACDPENPEAAIQLLLDAITHDVSTSPWLLVYDNVETPGSIGLLTPRGGAQVLVTTRWSDWPPDTRALPIDVFPRETAIAFLLAKANREDERSADDLATALGYLPLALSHARSACWRMNWRFTKYLECIPELVSKVPRDATYDSTVYATVDLAISSASSRVPKVEELVGFACFCDPDDLPLQFVTRGVMTDIEYGEATAALSELSLISQDRERSRVSVHRLVQEVARGRLRAQGNFAKLGALSLEVLAESATTSGHGGVIYGPFYASSSWRTALRHAADCNAEAARFLFAKLGFEGITRRALQEAEADFRAAIETSETHHLGVSKLATDLNNLAAFLLYQERFNEAEPYLLRARDALENSDGRPGLELALILDNLGVIREQQGNLAEAAELYRRSMQLRESSERVLYDELLDTVDNMCDVLLQFDDKAADPVLRRAIGISEEIDAGDSNQFSDRERRHLHRATRMCQLAEICSKRDEWREVESLARMALDLCLETDLDGVSFGFWWRLQTWHPRTSYPVRLKGTRGSVLWITVVNASLTLLKRALGQSRREQELATSLKRVIDVVRQREHLREPRALDPFDDLAYLYYEDGQFDMVARLMEEAIQLGKIRSCASGNEEGSRCMMLGAALARLERYDEAERSMRAAVSVLEAEQDADPQNLRMAIGNLISLLGASGRATEIEDLRKRLATLDAGADPASA